MKIRASNGTEAKSKGEEDLGLFTLPSRTARIQFVQKRRYSSSQSHNLQLGGALARQGAQAGRDGVEQDAHAIAAFAQGHHDALLLIDDLHARHAQYSL